MASQSEIPLISAPQRFQISLSGTQYQLRVKWCPPADCWTLDIADNSGAALVSGIPLVTGANLLEQYEYLGIPGELIVLSDDSMWNVPTYLNLGSIGHLYYIVE